MQFGSGFTFSSSFPLHLEGFAGFNRYDPTFVATNGQQQRRVPTKWNTFSGTGGIGWDIPFPFIPDLILRSIFNVSLGHVESDSSITRVRFMARHLIGENVSEVSGGISATWF